MVCNASALKYFCTLHLDADSLWTDLPFHVFNKIVLLLDLNSIRQCMSVCQNWRLRLQEDIIWKKLLLHYCDIQHLPPRHEKDSLFWHTEFKNLLCKPPTYLYMTLNYHVDEVLHVNISPNGKWIASSSRDKYVCICAIEEYSVTLSKKLSFGQRWDYIQFCDFSPDSSHLMVSGVLKAQSHFFGKYDELLQQVIQFAIGISTPKWVKGMPIYPGKFCSMTIH